MTLEESILDTVRSLPPEKQERILAFAQELKAEPKRSLESCYGILSDLNIRLSAEEIDEAEREMWSGFPRDDI